MAEELYPKRCKVIPRNNAQYIPDILTKRKRIDCPMELPLSKVELNRCMKYATVFEIREDGSHVLLDSQNWHQDNVDAPANDDMVPELEYKTPRDEPKEEEEGEDGDGDDEEDEPPAEPEPRDPSKVCPSYGEEDDELPDICIDDDDVVHYPRQEKGLPPTSSKDKGGSTSGSSSTCPDNCSGGNGSGSNSGTGAGRSDDDVDFEF